MGFFDALGDLLPGGLIDFGGKWLSNEFIGKPNAKTAWERSMEGSALAFQRSYDAYKRRYQDTTEDMRLAGLNPILAATSGFNVGSSPQMSAPQAFQPHQPLTSPVTAGKEFAEIGEIQEAERKHRMEIRKSRAEANKAIEQAYKILEEKKLVTAQMRNIRKQIILNDKRIWTELANFYKVTGEAYVAFSKEGLNEAMKTRVWKEIEKIEAEVRAQVLKLKELERSNEVFSGPVGLKIKYLQELQKGIRINTNLVPGLGKPVKGGKPK